MGLSGHHQLPAGSIPALEMLMTKVIGAVALGVALLSGISATADPDACQGAILVFKIGPEQRRRLP